MDEAAARMDEVRALLAALLRAALRDDDAARPWVEEARRIARALVVTEPGVTRPALAPSRLDGLWAGAIAQAEAPGEQEAERRVSLTMPVACPIGPAELAAPDFDVEGAVARIREAAGTG